MAPLTHQWIWCLWERQKQSRCHQIATKLISALVSRAALGGTYQSLWVLMVTIPTGLPRFPLRKSLLFRNVSARASKTEMQGQHGPKAVLSCWGLFGQTSLTGALCLDFTVLVKIFHLELGEKTPQTTDYQGAIVFVALKPVFEIMVSSRKVLPFLPLKRNQTLDRPGSEFPPGNKELKQNRDFPLRIWNICHSQPHFLLPDLAGFTLLFYFSLQTFQFSTLDLKFSGMWWLFIMKIQALGLKRYFKKWSGLNLVTLPPPTNVFIQYLFGLAFQNRNSFLALLILSYIFSVLKNRHRERNLKIKKKYYHMT